MINSLKLPLFADINRQTHFFCLQWKYCSESESRRKPAGWKCCFSDVKVILTAGSFYTWKMELFICLQEPRSNFQHCTQFSLYIHDLFPPSQPSLVRLHWRLKTKRKSKLTFLTNSSFIQFHRWWVFVKVAKQFHVKSHLFIEHIRNNASWPKCCTE